MSNIANSKYFNNYIKVILSILFVIVYIYMPWGDIRSQDFIDKQRYIVFLEAFSKEDISIKSLSELLRAFSSEYLWKEIISYLYYNIQDAELVLKIISSVVTFVIFWFTYTRTSLFNAAIILYNPLIIDLIFSQVRSALGISIIIISYQLSKINKIFILGVLISFFIHSGMLMIFLFFILIYYIDKNKLLKYKTKNYFSWCLGFVLSILIVYGLSIVLTGLEDRRASYSEVNQGSTVTYALYWFLLGGILIFSRDSMNQELNYFKLVGIFVSSLFLFLSLLNFYGSRFLALLLPIFLIAVFRTKFFGSTKLLRNTYLLYLAIQYYYWL